MAFRRVTCMIAVCDLCGGGEDGDGYTPHFDTDTEAVDYLTDCGWQLLDDGRLLCWRTDRVHEQAREDHGEAKIPDGAMTVTFSDPEPPCDPPPDITGADWHDANPQHAAVTSGGEVTS